MYDCRLSGGHYFVSHPQMTSYTCHRCRKLFHPPLRHSLTASTPTGSSSKPSETSPWRCILEKCAFTACTACSSHLNAELAKLAVLVEEAKKEGTLEGLGVEGRLREIERPPRKERSGRRGRGDPESGNGERGESGIGRKLRGGARLRRGDGDDMLVDCRDASGGKKRQSSGEQSDSDDDEEEEDSEDEMPIIPFRTAAMAAAAARSKVRNLNARPMVPGLRGREGRGEED